MNRAFTIGFAVGIVAAGALIVVVKRAEPNYPAKSLQTTILLQQNGTVCVATEPLQLRGQKNDQVKWIVRNSCSRPLVVKVDNFRAKLSDGTLDQNTPAGVVVPGNANLPDVRTANTVDAGGSGEINGKFNASVDHETFYKYEIFIGAPPAQPGGAVDWSRVRDPDIDIWP